MTGFPPHGFIGSPVTVDRNIIMCSKFLANNYTKNVCPERDAVVFQKAIGSLCH
jgi:hypothetical protein